MNKFLFVALIATMSCAFNYTKYSKDELAAVNKYRAKHINTTALKHNENLRKDNNDYVPFGNNLKIRFIDTDEEVVLSTLKDKVSYLVSHIASWYKYNATNYEDLIDSIKMNYDFRRIEEYVNQKYGKQIVFPDKYDGDIEDIVNINHQLISWGNTLNELLEDMTQNNWVVVNK